jgi:hypothetical protein
MTRWAKLSNARHFTQAALSILLLAASILRFWSEARYPQLPYRPWMDNRAIAYSTVAFEAILGLVLLSGLWPRPTWYATVATFGLFTLITAAETLQGKTSCGCFGSVQIRPVYTLFLDLTAVALLLVTGRPDRGSEVVGREEAG